MSDLEARLSRLETSNRRWKLGAMLLLGCGLLGAGAADRFPVERLNGFGYFEAVFCKQLIVKNDQGEDVASLVVIPESGECVFKLQNGKAKTMLVPGLPIVAGYDQNGTPWKIVR
jgi:hypothetical protein